MLYLELPLAVLAAASGLLYLACALAVRRYAGHPGGRPGADGPPVSLLVPVCGLESGAEATWSAFCTQDYGEYEVLFGVMDPADPAVPVLRRLVIRFPGRARLIPCPEPLGANHQVSNLMHLLRVARHECVVLADSDVSVRPEYLATVTAPLADPSLGVVTCGYMDHEPGSLGAALASLGRCVDFLPQVLVARWLDGGLRFALGATIATRKSVVAAFGGLEQVVNRIGSDYHIGQMAVQAGYRVEFSPYIVDNGSGRESIMQVFRRELRWARTIRMNRGRQFYGLVIAHGTLYGAALPLLTGFAPWAVALMGAVFLLRAAQTAVALRRFGARKLLVWVWAMPIRELLTFGVWSLSLLGNGVTWRGRCLRLRPGGLLEEF